MIKTIAINKAYQEQQILNGVELDIKQGEVYGLIGKNGAGKTTLMKILAGLMPQYEGTVEIKNENGEKASIGYLPDIPPFFDHMTTGEYLDFLLMYKSNERKKALLEFSHMNGGEIIKSLSRGMKQRFGIASLLTNNPDVILLDEPTSALDPGGRADVLDMILELKSQKKTIMLSTHVLNDMEKVCDKVGFLHRGVIQREVEIASIISDETKIRVKFADELGADNSPFDILQNVSKLSNNEYLVILNGEDEQRKFFDAMTKTNRRVAFLTTEAIKLDNLFKEVCNG